MVEGEGGEVVQTSISLEDDILPDFKLVSNPVKGPSRLAPD